ncbi:penicillin-binding protein 2 [Candidatus Microgenomates bacterium]|nr:penicillin-binding protein 2 [Candidatus Microgenomates bacterium]
MEWRKSLLTIATLIIFLVLAARLIDVSLIRGGYYQTLARNNRIRAIPIHAPRGLILDRNGMPLAQNSQTKKILHFEAGKAASLIDGQEIKDSENDVAILVWDRTYPVATVAAHLVGYVGEATREELGQSECPNSVYQIGDEIGRIGAESAFDCLLRGKNGEELVEVDSRGNKVRVLGRREAQKGQDVKLSIDLFLQQAAAAALGERKGAVVALNPGTGEILALVSYPSFDPNNFATNYASLIANPDQPLFNRAIGGSYPPGSTFKIVVSAAGLEEGKVDETTKFTDNGFIQVGTFKYNNWYFTKYGRTEGEIGIVSAITRSTDTFFYKVGEWVGVEKLAEWAKKFGLGAKTNVELTGETAGIIPTPDWKERNRGERWFLGNTYHMAIGQGDVAATPLQIAVMTGIIASGGKKCIPHIMKQDDLQNFQFPSLKGQASLLSNFQCEDIGLKQKTIEVIRQGMIGACSPGGTAGVFFNFKVPVACKTGTAEFGDDKKKAHAWFTSFAPAENPEIVVTSIVEGGGEGSSVAAPITKQVLESYFAN